MQQKKEKRSKTDQKKEIVGELDPTKFKCLLCKEWRDIGEKRFIGINWEVICLECKKKMLKEISKEEDKLSEMKKCIQ